MIAEPNQLRCRSVVVTAKLQRLDQVLLELGSPGELTVERLQAEWRVWRAVERDLQRAVEVLIDSFSGSCRYKGTPAAHRSGGPGGLRGTGMLERPQSVFATSWCTTTTNCSLDVLADFRECWPFSAPERLSALLEPLTWVKSAWLYGSRTRG